MAGLVVLTVAGLLRKWRANDELAGSPKKTPSTAAPTTSVQAPMPSAMGSSKAVLKLDRLWFNRSRLQQAILRFEKYLLPEAQRSEHPWALAHGLIAFGKDLVADNQKPAIDVIVLAAEAEQIEGRKRYVWPRR